MNSPTNVSFQLPAVMGSEMILGHLIAEALPARYGLCGLLSLHPTGPLDSHLVDGMAGKWKQFEQCDLPTLLDEFGIFLSPIFFHWSFGVLQSII